MKSLITMCGLCVVLILSVLIAGPFPVWAKDPINKNWKGLAIKGYDPVAYFTLGKPVKGKSEFEYKWEGGTVEWTEHVVDPDVALPGDISLNDIDVDEDLDIVVTVLEDDELVWYENEIPRPSVCPIEFLLGEDSEKTQLLRYIRDEVLSKTKSGRELIRLYYQWSPVIVEAVEEDEEFKEAVKALIDGVFGLVEEAE